MPTINPFNEFTSPDDSMDVYKTHMYVWVVDDVTYCLYFLTMLKGIMQKWFNGLPNGSVASSD